MCRGATFHFGCDDCPIRLSANYLYCLFIPFNLLCKSTTIVGRQILRSGFDPETNSKGPLNSRLFKPTVPYIHAAMGKKEEQAGAEWPF